MFNPQDIEKQVTSLLNESVDIPTGHKGALVTFFDNDGATIAIGTKIKDNWTVELLGKHSWKGDNTIGAMSKITW